MGSDGLGSTVQARTSEPASQQEERERWLGRRHKSRHMDPREKGERDGEKEGVSSPLKPSLGRRTNEREKEEGRERGTERREEERDRRKEGRLHEQRKEGRTLFLSFFSTYQKNCNHIGPTKKGGRGKKERKKEKKWLWFRFIESSPKFLFSLLFNSSEHEENHVAYEIANLNFFFKFSFSNWTVGVLERTTRCRKVSTIPVSKVYPCILSRMVSFAYWWKRWLPLVEMFIILYIQYIWYMVILHIGECANSHWTSSVQCKEKKSSGELSILCILAKSFCILLFLQSSLFLKIYLDVRHFLNLASSHEGKIFANLQR